MSANLTQSAGHEALETLRLMLMDEDVSDAARVSAARALLDRFLPKDDAERERREADERNAALADARVLLAELGALAAAGFASPCAPAALAEDGAFRANHAAE